MRRGLRALFHTLRLTPYALHSTPRTLLFTLMMSLVASGAHAADLPVPLSKALKRLSAINGFSCSFEQLLLFADGSRQSYSGTLAVSRPMRFRWHYTEPYEQLFISDGSRIWHYEPELMQVSILHDIEQIDPVIMHLLDGSVGLKDIVLIKADTGRRRYHVRIGAGSRVWLELTAEGRLSAVESVDVLGNRNRIRLSGISEIQPAASEFTFSVPAGVDVLEDNG